MRRIFLLLVLFILTLSIAMATAVVMFLQSNVKTEKQTAAEQALAFIKDVVIIDVARYDVDLPGHNTRSDQHGGVPTEMFKYTLNSDNSKLHCIIDFVNGTLCGYTLHIDDGVPFYTKPPSAVANEAKETFARLQHFSEFSYPTEMTNMLNLLDSSTTNMTLESTNLKLTAFFQGNNASIKCFYTENGIEYLRKGISLTFENGNLKTLGNDWSLYTVGSSTTAVSRENALKTAFEAVENYKLNITLGPNNTVQPSFTIDADRVVIELASAEREPLTLQLLWTTHLYLKTPVYRTYAFVVSQWADAEEIRYISPISGGT